MDTDSSLNHSRWECKCHVIWMPKYRKKTLYGQLRKYLGQVFKELARQKESEVLEGYMMPDFRGPEINEIPRCSQQG